MTPERWQRVRQVFEQALEAPEGSRDALLDEVCAGDRELRADVESLLHHHGRLDERFLEPRGVKLRLGPERPEPWARSLIGRRIGRYTVTCLIGSGGMGCVFEARQDQPARVVALKVLQPGFSAPSALARFHLEPEVLGRLQHPNIAQVFEAGVHEDEQRAVPYFAMELIPDARPLLEYAEARELTIPQRLELFTKVCDAVHHGHQKGIIHRDLKPANIVVGQDGEPKVIDFGVARASDADIVMTTQCTHVGDLVGTVHYMSPEQCDGNPALIDTRSDVYALGVVLYELLTGTSPYQTAGTTVYEMIRVIKEVPPRRPSSVDRRLRGDLDTIILKCLDKDQAKRYNSTAALAEDIERYMRGEPISARPPTRWTKAARWAARHPMMMTGAACASLAVTTLAAVAITVWTYDRVPYEIEPTWETIRRANAQGKPMDYSQAHLLTRSGRDLHAWPHGATPRERRIGQALLVKRDETYGGGKLALVAYTPDPRNEYASELCAYDLGGDRDRPVWHKGMTKEHLPQDQIDLGRPPQNCYPRFLHAADIFQERPGEEIVSIWVNGLFSQRAIRIYDAAGELLYQVWQNGGAEGGCCWLSRPGLLVFAGADERLKDATQRSGDQASLFGPVVFALRPFLGDGAVSNEYLERQPSLSRHRPTWYRYVHPLSTKERYFTVEVSTPDSGSDAERCTVVTIELGEPVVAALDLLIDEAGKEVLGKRTANDEYRRLRIQGKLPDASEFKLCDEPPVAVLAEPPGHEADCQRHPETASKRPV